MDKPFWKSKKFLAFALVALLFAGSLLANALSPGAVQPDVQTILASAVGVGLQSYTIAQGLVDKEREKQGVTFSE